MAKSRENLEAELKGWQRVYKAAEKRNDKAGMQEAHAKANEIRRQMGTAKSESQAEAELNGWGYVYNAAKRRDDTEGMAQAHSKANEIRAEQGWEYDPDSGKTKEKILGPIKRTVNSKTVMENAKIWDPKQVKPMKPTPTRTVTSPASSYLTGPRVTASASPAAASMQQKTGDDKLKELAQRVVPGNEDKWSPEGIAKGFGYGAERTLSGAAGALEDAARFVSGYGNKLLSGITSLGGLADNPVSDYLARTAENTLSNSFTDRWRTGIEERYQPDELSQKIGDIGEAAGAMLPTIAAGLASGGLSAGTAIGKGASMTAQAARAVEQLQRGIGLSAMLPSVMGSSTRQAMQEGADINEALAYGALSGALETGTESMFAGIPGIKSGIASDILRKATQNPIVNRVADTLGEGVEEVVSGILTPYLQRMTYNEQAELASNEDLMNQFVSGVLISGLMQGATGIAGRIAQPRESSNLDTSGLGENSRRSYEYLKSRNQSTPDFDAQWSRYNQMGNAGIPLDQVEDYPSRTPIDKATAYAAHAAGMNDYRARAVQDAQDILDGKTMQDSTIDRALDVPESRKMLETAIGKTLPDSYAKARKMVWDWQAGQESEKRGVEVVPLTTFDEAGVPETAFSESSAKTLEKLQEISERSGQSVTELANNMRAIYEQRRDESIQNASDYIKSYQPQGVSVVGRDETTGQGGYRVSNNEPWYQEFYRKNGHAPRVSDIPELAQELVQQDKSGTQFGFSAADANTMEDYREISESISNQKGFRGVRKTEEGTYQAIYDRPVEMPKTPGLVQNQYAAAVDRGTSDAIDRIAKKAGITVEIADDVPAAGEYKDGVIRINANAQNPVRQVFVHELTHHLERSGDYQVFSDLIRKHYEADGVDFSAYLKDIQEQYAESGVELSEAGAMKEAVAEISETMLFTDERSVQRLAQENRGLIQKIRDWLHEMRIKLAGTKEEKFVLEAEKMYQKALDSTRGQKNNAPGGTQYKIEKATDGTSFVDVTEDILDGKTEKDHARILSDIIQNKFGNIIQANGQTFGINSKTNSEWRRSKSANRLYQKNRTAYLDKIQSFQNADELMTASRDYVGEGLRHPRKDNFVEFARGKVDYKVGERGYEADVIVGIRKNGQADLYDIVNIQDKNITEARILPVNGKEISAPIDGASVTSSIPPSSQNSNPGGQNISEKPVKFKGLALQKEYRQAVERGDMEHARDMLKAKAEQRGYKAYDTASERQNHVIQTANPVQDDYHTWIRDAGEIRTFEQTLQDPEWNGMDFDPDYTWEMAQDALRDGKIKVYSSYPIGTLGGFVSPSRMEAETYAGDGTVYEGTVKLDDVAWIDPTQGQYAPTTEADVYKEGSPYPKALDVTYDESGKLIPFSQRYDSSNPDRRYKVGSGNFFDRLERTGQKDVADRIRKRMRGKELNPFEFLRLTPEEVNTTPELEALDTSSERGGNSKFYGSTQSTSILDEHAKELIRNEDDVRYYQNISNQQTLEEANSRLNEGGAAETLRWANLDPEDATAQDIAEGFILMKRYQDAGDYDSMVTVVKKLRQMGTRAGQTVQAFSILGRMTPESMSVYAQKELDQAKRDMIRQMGDAWVDKRKKMFDLTAEEVKFIQQRMEVAYKLPEGRDKNIQLAQIAQLIQDKIPTSVGRMVKGFARNSMLLNPKTMLRNVVGNVIMMPANLIQDTIGAAVDMAAGKATGVRTSGRPELAGPSRAFARGAFESFDDFRRHINTRQMTGDRFEAGTGNDFRRYSRSDIKQAVPPKKLLYGLSNALNGLDRVTGFLLDAGDRPFFEMYFTHSLNRQMKLNKAAEPTADMIEIATNEAMQRTWQDDNGYTKFVTNLRNGLNFGKNYGLGSVLMPFAKTPANLTKALVEYSPAGVVRAITKDASDLVHAQKTGKGVPKTQKRFVDDLSKGITGTLVLMAGYWLAQAGIISGQKPEDDDEAAFLKNVMGIAPYSVRINGTSYSYDWAQPVGGLLAMGADFAKSMETDKNPDDKARILMKSAAKNILNAISTGGNVLFEQSFMQSVQELFQEEGLVQGLISAAAGAPSQFVPTALSQIAQITDPVARTSFVYGDIPQTAKNRALAKMPGKKETLAPVVDVLGNEVLGNGGNNAWYNVMLNPANQYPDTSTKAAREIYRVYSETGDTTVIPRIAPYYLEQKDDETGEKKKYIFTPIERAEYQKTAGKTNERLVDDALKFSGYQNLSNTDQAEVHKAFVSYANELAEAAYFKKHGIAHELSSKAVKIQEAEKAGVPAAQYLTAYVMQAGIERGLSYQKGKHQGDTIPDSKGLLIMQAVNGVEGLDDAKRKTLYESFGVGKKVVHYNPAKVEQALSKMKNQ